VLPVELPAKLSLHCHKTTGLEKYFDNKYTILHAVHHLAQWVLFVGCKLLTFTYPVVPTTFHFSQKSFHNCVHFKLPHVFLNLLYTTKANVLDQFYKDFPVPWKILWPSWNFFRSEEIIMNFQNKKLKKAERADYQWGTFAWCDGKTKTDVPCVSSTQSRNHHVQEHREAKSYHIT
jgi:hypothetical protein